MHLPDAILVEINDFLKLGDYVFVSEACRPQSLDVWFDLLERCW